MAKEFGFKKIHAGAYRMDIPGFDDVLVSRAGGELALRINNRMVLRVNEEAHNNAYFGWEMVKNKIKDYYCYRPEFN